MLKTQDTHTHAHTCTRTSTHKDTCTCTCTHTHAHAHIHTHAAAAQDALDLTVSLSSLSTYLATVNISDSRFYGMWQLSFTTSYSYKVYITGDSTMGFGYELHRSDKAATLGLRKVKDKVLQGQVTNK